ncbi:MAG: cytochrome c biogenesis protein CcsA [Anaerolineaceae bacterium]|nr:cytochrome c biogenesis protein CcsA [Anaerolineaceae bacterium]
MSQAIEVCALPAERQPGLLRLLNILTVLALPLGLYVALVHAGTDASQGDVQRLFYLHMPSFFGAALAFGGALLASIAYLVKRETCYDSFAVAGVEVGLTLALVNLVSGSIWARPIWNTWWTWDPRLTSAAVMCLTYAAWLVLRNGIDNPQQRRRLASVYAILAYVTVILTLIIIRIRPDTIHPAVIGPSAVNAQGSFELAATPGVTTALLVNFPIWALLLPLTLLWHRYRLQLRIEALEQRKALVLNAPLRTAKGSD